VVAEQAPGPGSGEDPLHPGSTGIETDGAPLLDLPAATRERVLRRDQAPIAQRTVVLTDEDRHALVVAEEEPVGVGRELQGGEKELIECETPPLSPPLDLERKADGDGAFLLGRIPSRHPDGDAEQDHEQDGERERPGRAAGARRPARLLRRRGFAASSDGGEEMPEEAIRQDQAQDRTGEDQQALQRVELRELRGRIQDQEAGPDQVEGVGDGWSQGDQQDPAGAAGREPGHVDDGDQGQDLDEAKSAAGVDDHRHAVGPVDHVALPEEGEAQEGEQRGRVACDPHLEEVEGLVRQDRRKRDREEEDDQGEQRGPGETHPEPEQARAERDPHEGHQDQVAGSRVLAPRERREADPQRQAGENR
jgi:hypothetical protein